MIHSSLHAMSRLEAPRALGAGWVLLALQRVQRALEALPRHLRSHAAVVTHLQPAQEGHVLLGSAVHCQSPLASATFCTQWGQLWVAREAAPAP